MTGNRYEQARAIFLSALMVVSVFGATVAFAGAASADVGSFAVDASDHDTRSDNTEFGVSGTVSADGNDVTLQFTDSEDNTDTVTLTEDADSDAQFDQNVDLSSTFSESGPAEGTLTVEVDEGSSFSSAEASTTVTVDDTSPTVNSHTPSSGAEVASTTQEITVDLQEQGSGIDTNTVQVVLDDGTDEFVDLTGTGPGIQYDQSNTDIIITPGDGRVPELPEGTVNWEIQADDNAGNSLTDSDSFSVVPAIPSVTLDSSQNTLLNTRQPNNVQFDLDDSDSYADIKSVEVTARNPSSGSIVAGIDGSTDSDSFISYSDGAGTDELTVDIGDASPSKTLADGDTEFVVTGYTETGQQGDSFSSTFTIETDTDAPSINSISTSVNQPATESNTGSSNTIDVQVTFDESMDTGAAYTPDVQLTGAASSDYEIDAISNGNNGWSNSGQTWTGEFDLTDDNEEVTGTIEVTASSAVDEAGNSLSGSNSIDFDIDTLGPTVNPVSGEIEDDVSQPSSSYSDGVGDGADSTDVDEIEGSIGLDQHFTVSDADNNGLTYQIASYSDVEDNSDPFEADEQGAYTTIDADYDTRSISDGYYVITASTADDNGNSNADSFVVFIDNHDLSVTETHPDTEQDVTGTITASDVFDLQGGSVSSLEYASGDVSNPGDTSAVSNNELDTTQLSDRTFTIEVTYTEPGESVTKTTTVNVNNKLNIVDGPDDDNSADNLAFSDADTTDSEATLSFTTDESVEELRVEVSQSDSYFAGYTTTLTEDDFSETINDGTYTYSYTWTAPRDGEFEADLLGASSTNTDQTLDDALTTGSFQTTGTKIIDTSTPTIVDADIAGANTDGRTQVRVQFSEPVSSVGTLKLADGSSSTTEVINDDGTTDGEVTVEFDQILQTGDGLQVEYDSEAVTETYDAADLDAAEPNPTAINRTVDTVDLNLGEGQNLVSIPAETGTVSLSDLNTDHVETVYAWDDGSWTGYAPGDTTSDLQNLEGGQGYVFVMSAADEIPVQAYNKPGETGNGPAPLTDENIETGWNLIGHYQEANQDRDVALTELSGSYDASNVLGEQTDGDFGPVTQLRPGEGYWLYASQSDNYARSPFAGPVVSSLQVVEGDGSTNLETEADETVDISVEVTDVDGVDTVTADLSNLNGASDVTLSDSNNDDVYTTTKTLDLSGVTVGSQSVSVTATDAAADSTSSSVNVEVVATGDLADGGSSSVGSTEVEAGESTSQTLTLDVDGLSADGNTDTVTVTLTGASTVSSPGVSIDGSSAGSIEGSANVQKTNEITFDVSADGSGTYDGTFTVTATATYDAAGMSHDQTYSVTDSDGDTLNSVVLTGSVADTTGSDLKSTNTQTGSATGVIDVQATASDNEGGDIYYVVVADGDPSPTASDIKSGSAATGGSLQDSGSFTDVSAGTQTAGQTVGSLGGGTAVDVYYVQVDDAGNAGSPVSDDVTAGTA